MISGYVAGADTVTARLKAFGPRLREELRAAIERLAIATQRKVRHEKLSGQVLNVRTDLLRGSIDERVFDNGASVIGVVSTNVSYAKAHEYGYRGPISVKEHLSRSKLGLQFSVRAHTANVNIPERSFLRSALSDVEAAGTVRREMLKAMRGADA